MKLPPPKLAFIVLRSHIYFVGDVNVYPILHEASDEGHIAV